MCPIRTIADIRNDYRRATLDPSEVDPDPIAQFQAWFEEAIEAGTPEVNAMTLATVDEAGLPRARIVLLKGVDALGFTFFTNYESAKGRELDRRPRAALVFFWPALERQVRIEGDVDRVSGADSDAYFVTRPRDSQIAAWASPQSAVVPDRDFLEARIERVADEHRGDVPRPPGWGGYRVTPTRIELWQGRAGRLHDRVEYLKVDDAWRRRRLAP